MLRPILVCLGMFAAVGGLSKCGGAVVSERSGTNDAGSSEPAANAASGRPLQVPGASGFGGGASGTQGPTGTGPSLGGPVLVGGSDGCQSDAGPGGAPGLVTLASGQTCPWGMAIDAINVYWTECGDPTGGFVLKVPKAGGDVVALASGDRLSGIATDGTNVYWVAGTSDASSGAIMKVPVVGGTPTTLAARSGDPAHLVVDDSYAYWGEMTGGSIMKVPLTGGTPSEVAPAEMPFQLTVDATDVYWLGNGVMKALRRSGERRFN